MPYSILVIGSPGAGKSSFCQGLQQILRQLGRKCAFVNLDPASDFVLFDADVDVRTLVDFEQIMSSCQIGPNSALLKSLEILEEKVNELSSLLNEFDQESFFVFDCPGQVELYTTHNSLLSIINSLNFSFAVVNLVDSSQCQDKYSFMSQTMLTLQSMLHLGLPQVNILSKIDLLTSGLSAPLPIYCFAELNILFKICNDGSEHERYSKLTECVSELIEEQGLVSFVPMAVQDKDCMLFLLSEIDRVIGVAFGALSLGNDTIQEAAYSSFQFEEYLGIMEERYLTAPVEPGV